MGSRPGPGRIHPVDHPVVARLGRRRSEQPVAPLRRSPWNVTSTLSSVPLVDLVGAAVPDPHLAGAVLALWGSRPRIEVLERVVLGVDGEPVLARSGRDSVGDRERGQHAIVLEAQIPVQAGRVMLVDDEPPGLLVGLGRGSAPSARGLGRGLEVALGAVAVESLSGHCNASGSELRYAVVTGVGIGRWRRGGAAGSSLRGRWWCRRGPRCCPGIGRDDQRLLSGDHQQRYGRPGRDGRQRPHHRSRRRSDLHGSRPGGGNAGERALAFNITGPQGTPGPQGPPARRAPRAPAEAPARPARPRRSPPGAR